MSRPGNEPVSELSSQCDSHDVRSQLKRTIVLRNGGNFDTSVRCIEAQRRRP